MSQPNTELESLLPILNQPSTRRTVMKAAGAALGLAAFGRAVSPLWSIPENVSVDEFLQQHYKELSDDDKQKVFARLEAETKEDLGIDVTITDVRPIPGVRYGYAINLSKCNGNGACMKACNEENNHDRNSDQSYIRVLEMTKGSMDMEQGNTNYDHTVPQDDKYYMPVQCQQC
ncbi:MAG: 4Fe-4S ferredoxin, partial [Planctomicrobium sp.]|nr:4Fe-4S ferredoxin [Planctomicrobium sp.]